MSQKRAPDPFPVFEATGTPEDMRGLDANIETVADELIAALDHSETGIAAKAPDGLKPEHVRFLTYALFVFSVRRRLPLTEDHLRLLHKALGIKRGSPKAAEYIGLPPVKKPHEFLAAAHLEASDPHISDYALAKAVRVDETTIKDWREMKLFQERVRTNQYLSGHRTEEEEAIDAEWERILDRLGLLKKSDRE